MQAQSEGWIYPVKFKPGAKRIPGLPFGIEPPPIIPDLAEAKRRAARRPDLPIGSEALLIAGIDGFAPVSHMESPAGGIAVAMIRVAFERIEVFAAFDFMSLDDAVTLAEAGEYSAIAPVAYDPELEQRFFFSKPIYEDAVFAFVSADRDAPSNAKADFHGDTVCRPAGRSLTIVERLHSSEDIVLLTADSLEVCAKLLAEGRVDVVFELEVVMLPVLERMKLVKEINRSDASFGVVTFHAAFPRGRVGAERFLGLFDEALSNMQGDETYTVVVTELLAANGLLAVVTQELGVRRIRAVSRQQWGDDGGLSLGDASFGSGTTTAGSGGGNGGGSGGGNGGGNGGGKGGGRGGD